MYRRQGPEAPHGENRLRGFSYRGSKHWWQAAQTRLAHRCDILETGFLALFAREFPRHMRWQRQHRGFSGVSGRARRADRARSGVRDHSQSVCRGAAECGLDHRSGLAVLFGAGTRPLAPPVRPAGQIAAGSRLRKNFEARARLGLSHDGIPDFAILSEKLSALTGWRVVPVAGLIPDDAFFDLLADRRFPAGAFIRPEAELDYLEEPDVFHDVFGHVPLLANPDYAAFLEAYGKGGRRALERGQLHNLARLYWYTVEFGLINTPDGLRIFGAGILSSPAETIFALEDASPNRVAFDLERVMRTKVIIDDFQQTYFVIDSYANSSRTATRISTPFTSASAPVRSSSRTRSMMAIASSPKAISAISAPRARPEPWPPPARWPRKQIAPAHPASRCARGRRT